MNDSWLVKLRDRSNIAIADNRPVSQDTTVRKKVASIESFGGTSNKKSERPFPDPEQHKSVLHAIEQ